MPKIEKILSLGETDFNLGVAATAYSPNRGLWSLGYGVKPFAAYGSSGILQVGDNGTELGAATITQAVKAGVNHASSATGSMYFLAGTTTGHFYKLTSGDVVTNLRSATPITDNNYAVEIYRPQAGTEYLYYFQDTQIGRWDLAGTYPTGWVDNHFTGLADVDHYSHKFFGDVYYTNGAKIGKIYDNAGTAANNTNVLDFPSEYTAIGLADDGTYLAILVTTKNVSNSFRGYTKVLFWDTFSSSWNREFEIPDSAVTGIRRVGDRLFAIGYSGIYPLSFNSAPKLIQPLIPGDAPSLQNGCVEWNNWFIWVGDTGSFVNYVGMFGEVYENPTAYHQPFLLPSLGTFIFPKSDREILVYTNDGLYKFDINATGTASDLTLTTKVFDLKGTWNIKRIDITFVDALESGESVEIYLARGSETQVSWGTASFAINGAVYRAKIPMGASYSAESLYLAPVINGTPAIRRIDVYGERLNDV